MRGHAVLRKNKDSWKAGEMDWRREDMAVSNGRHEGGRGEKMRRGEKRWGQARVRKGDGKGDERG